MSHHFKKRFAFLVVFCAFFCSFQLIVSAQDKDWRPVLPQELEMKAPVVEPNADAEAIFWEIKLDDSSDTELKRTNYVRVKIFNERGREKFSKVDIPFLKGLKVKDVAARVIKPDGSIVELKKEDIFEREIIKGEGVKIKAKSFAVPGIEPGVLIEYRYREVFEDSGAVGMRLAFQQDIPVQSLSYYYKPYNKKEPNFQTFNMERTNFVKDKDGFYLASQSNVPSFKEEPRMPPEDQVRPWMLLQAIRVQLLDYNGLTGAGSFSIKDPSNPQVYWGSFIAEKAPYFQAMIKGSKDVKTLAEQITASAATPDDKLKKLYEYCQTQYKNVIFDQTATEQQRKDASGFKSVTDVVKKGFGRPTFITMLFGSMANALGYETRIVYMGDRSEMFFKPDMTNENFLHLDAVAVKIGEGWKFFNPGMSFMPYGSLHWSDEDVWALVTSDKTYSWVKTPVTSYNRSLSKRTGKFKLLEDGTLEGDVHVELAGQTGVNYKMSNYSDSPTKREDDLKEEIKKFMSTAEISGMSIENVTDPEKPFTYAYKVRVPNYAQKTGKRLFLQPGYFEYGKPSMFPSASRKYDIYFQYPWSEQDEIQIELPKGFALDNAEQPADGGDSQKITSLAVRISIDKEKNILVYRRNFYFGGSDRMLFPSGAYQNLKNLFDGFQKTDSHTITLKQN